MTAMREIERFIDDEVAAGRYRSASDVMREALRLLQEHGEERAARLARLRRAVRRGLDELADGDGPLAPGPLFEDLVTTPSPEGEPRRDAGADPAGGRDSGADPGGGPEPGARAAPAEPHERPSRRILR